MPKSGEHNVNNIDSFFRVRPSRTNLREGETVSFLEDGKLVKQEKRNGVVYEIKLTELGKQDKVKSEKTTASSSSSSSSAGLISAITAGAGLTGGGTTGTVNLDVGQGTGITVSSNSVSIDSTVVTLTGSQILTNKTISGSSNTLTNIGNSSLTNSSITVTAGSGLTDGGSVSLGSSTTLNVGAGTGITVNADDIAVDTATIFASPTFTGTTNAANLTLSGNLIVNGTTTTIDTDTLTVEDPLIKLAKANSASDTVDIGFYGLYDTSGSQDLYAGLFRDADDSGKFKLFKDLQTEPTSTVNVLGTGYTTGTLVAALEGNASTATALETARTFTLTGEITAGGVSFDGTGNVSLSTAISAGVIEDGDIASDAAITITKLASYTISGVSLGGTLGALTLSSPLSFTSGTSYTGAAARNIELDVASINHDALANYVANEHIDWTAASAGTIHPSNYTDTSQATTFVIQDSGTPSNVTISQGKYVKFQALNNGGLDIQWASPLGAGSSGDPYDLQFQIDLGNLPAMAGSLSGTDNIAVYDSVEGTVLVTAQEIADLASAGLTYNGSTANGVLTYGSSTTIDVESNLTFDGTNLDLPDSKKIRLGTSQDLEIYHDSFNNYIDSNTLDQDLYIRVNDGGVTTNAIIIDASAEARVKLPNDNQQLAIGAGQDLKLYHLNDTSIIYNATGGLTMENAGASALIIKNSSSNQDILFSVNDGGVTTTALQIDASEIANVRLPNDGQKLSIGDGYDLQLHHTSGNSFIANSFTGDLYIQNSVDDRDIILRTDDGAGGVTPYITLDGSESRVDFFSGRIYLKNDGTFHWGSAAAHGILSWDTGRAIVTATGANNLDLKAASGYSVVVNESGSNVDFRVEGDTDANLFFVDAGTDRVGIGTISPQTKLEVKTAKDNINTILSAPLATIGDLTPYLNYQDLEFRNNYVNATGTAKVRLRHHSNLYVNSGSQFSIATSTTGGTITEALRIDNSQRVGIGTTSPGAKLHIAEGFAYIYKTNDVGKLELRDSRASYDAEISQRSDGRISLATRAGTYGSNGSIEILDSGNVGIGTASPGYKLEIEGSTNTDLLALDGAGTGFRLLGKSGDGSISNSMVYRLYLDYGLGTATNGFIDFYRGGDGASGYLTFGTSGTEKMRINSSGNVGIGTSILDAGAKLNVVSGSSSYTAQFSRHDADDGLFLHSEAQSTHYNWLISTQDNVDAGFEITPSTAVGNRSFTTPAFVIKANTGNVGIGTTSPGNKLEVRGDIAVAISDTQDIIKLSDAGNDGSIEIYTGEATPTLRTKIVSYGDTYFNAASTGRVGIGTASPSYKLDVAGDARSDRLIFRTNASAPTADAAVYRAADNTFAISTNNTERMRIASNGNMIVGSDYTTNAATKLVVSHSGANGILLNQDASNTANSGRLFFEGTSTSAIFQSGNALSFRTGATTGSSSGTQRFYINTAGATVVGNLNVSGNSFMNYGLVVNETANDADFRVEGTSDTHLLLTDAANNRVGIGTASPSFKLKVNVDNGTYTNWETIAGFQSKRGADTEYEAGIMINSLGDALGGQISSNWYWSNNTGAKGNTGRSAGIFGISNSASNESEFYWQTTAYNNTTLTTQMKLDNGQNLHVAGDVVAYSTSVSDKRLKDNIKTIDNALDKVMALRGVEFDWNATSRSGQHDIGLIAQEVEEVIPEVVREKKLQTGEFTDNEKTFKTIDYDKMVGVLVEAIKEQQQQINELKEKLNG